MALACGPAMALYKVVGPDGKVTYTDRPPADVPSQQLKANGVSVPTSGLPFELRQVADKYPVTLYTSKDCSVCTLGRQLLQRRGVPFTEKTVNSNEDTLALQKQEGTQQVPVLRVGRQQVIGYVERDWHAYLDAAGYPKQSTLPSRYTPAAATSLAPASEASSASGSKAADAASRTASMSRPAPQAVRQPADNPPSSGTKDDKPRFRF
jgi:glutaredoxin